MSGTTRSRALPGVCFSVRNRKRVLRRWPRDPLPARPLYTWRRGNAKGTMVAQVDTKEPEIVSSPAAWLWVACGRVYHARLGRNKSKSPSRNKPRKGRKRIPGTPCDGRDRSRSAGILRLRLAFALIAQRPILAQDDKTKSKLYGAMRPGRPDRRIVWGRVSDPSRRPRSTGPQRSATEASRSPNPQAASKCESDSRRHKDSSSEGAQECSPPRKRWVSPT